MNKKNKEKVLTPFEQNRKNINDFHENVKLCESAMLLVEAAKVLQIPYDENESEELVQLGKMLDSTIIQFSEFLEDRGDKWN